MAQPSQPTGKQIGPLQDALLNAFSYNELHNGVFYSVLLLK